MPLSSTSGSLSPSSASGSGSADASLSTLNYVPNDAEVGVLHEMVCVAEKHPLIHTHTSKALFDARDEVLTRYGEDPDDDGVYLRILLRLAVPRGGGLGGVYERFEALLGEMGIRIEWERSSPDGTRSSVERTTDDADIIREEGEREREEDRGYLGDQDTRSFTSTGDEGVAAAASVGGEMVKDEEMSVGGEIVKEEGEDEGEESSVDILALVAEETTLESVDSTTGVPDAMGVRPAVGVLQDEKENMAAEEYPDSDDDEALGKEKLEAMERAADAFRRRKLLGRLMLGAREMPAETSPPPTGVPPAVGVPQPNVAPRDVSTPTAPLPATRPPLISPLPVLSDLEWTVPLPPTLSPRPDAASTAPRQVVVQETHDLDRDYAETDEPSPEKVAAMEKAADEFRRRKLLGRLMPSATPFPPVEAATGPYPRPGNVPSFRPRDESKQTVDTDQNDRDTAENEALSPTGVAVREKTPDDARRRDLLSGLNSTVDVTQTLPPADARVPQDASQIQATRPVRRGIFDDLISPRETTPLTAEQEQVDLPKLLQIRLKKTSRQDWEYLQETQRALSVHRADEEPEWEKKKSAWAVRAGIRADIASDQHWQAVALRAMVAEYRQRLVEGTSWRHYLRRHLALRQKYGALWRQRVQERIAAQQAREREQRAPHFLGRWMARQRQVIATAEKAISTHATTMRDEMYQRWKWARWEKHAEDYDVGRLQASFLGRMLDVLRGRRELEAWGDQVPKRALAKNYVRKLEDRHQLARAQAEQAQQFRDHTLLSRSLRLIATSARLAPIAERVSHMVDWRVARTYFTTWVFRSQCQRVAKEVDERRLLRHFWHEWNDRLRERILGYQIDERVVRQTLHTWIRKNRELLFSRQRDERLLQHYLGTLVTGFRTLMGGLTDRLVAFQQAQARRIQHRYLHRWGLQLELVRRREAVADAFHIPAVQARVLQKLRRRTETMHRMEREADIAAYYIRAKRTFARLRAKWEARKKEKYKAAYAQMRVTVKIRLARGFFRLWRERLAAVQDHDRLAGQIDRYRTVAQAVGQFRHWHARAGEVRMMEARGGEVYEKNLLQRHLDTWINYHDHNAGLHEQAVVQDEVRVANLAGDLVRKIGLRGFQIRNNLRSAEALQARNDKKHGINILRYWRERTEQRRYERWEQEQEQGMAARDDAREGVREEYGRLPDMAVENEGTREQVRLRESLGLSPPKMAFTIEDLFDEDDIPEEEEEEDEDRDGGGEREGVHEQGRPGVLPPAPTPRRPDTSGIPRRAADLPSPARPETTRTPRRPDTAPAPRRPELAQAQSMIPQPGYLQTPSRRALRAKALRRSAVTPGPGVGAGPSNLGR